MINRISIIIIFTLLNVIGTSSANSQGEITAEKGGVLQGKVSIGPLCPVEPCHLSPGQLAKVYEPRKVIVYDQSTKTKIAKLDLNQDGEYSISLKPGKYIIDVTDGKGNELPLEKPRSRMSRNVHPKEFEIKAGEKFEVNFDIDTGIR